MPAIYSHQTGTAINVVFAKEPSDLIPFKGEFPIVPEWRVRQFYEVEHSYSRLEDCPEWFQQAVIKGCEIDAIDKGFRNWLDKRNIKIDDYKKYEGGAITAGVAANIFTLSFTTRQGGW